MSLKYISGDILESKTEVLAHGVAYLDIEDMGTGLARQINRKWPDSFRRFKKQRRSNSFKLGEVIVDWENTPAIAYLATQPNLYNADEKHVNHSLRNFRKVLEKKGVKTCSIPKIGCGYGKLEWDAVKNIIERRLGSSDIEFSVYEAFNSSESR